jgi:hypothetical protein
MAAHLKIEDVMAGSLLTAPSSRRIYQFQLSPDQPVNPTLSLPRSAAKEVFTHKGDEDMKSTTVFEKMSLLVVGICVLFAFPGCGGGSAVKSDTAIPAEAPLEKKYNKIVFKKFQADPAVEADYPGVVATCENTAITAVKSKNIFAVVETENAGTKYYNALIVKTRITSLRIVSGSARFWFGAAAGGSEMSLLMELIDASSGNVVREKALSTANNPFAATMTGGSTDRSLSSDLANIMAEYINLLQPQDNKVIKNLTPASQNDSIDKESSPSSQAAKTLVIIKTTNIKSEPNAKSKTLVKLKKGTMVEYLGKSGNWLNVKLSTGATGWVPNGLVKEEK